MLVDGGCSGRAGWGGLDMWGAGEREDAERLNARGAAREEEEEEGEREGKRRGETLDRGRTTRERDEAAIASLVLDLPVALRGRISCGAHAGSGCC